MDRNDPNAWFTSGYLSHNGEVISNFCSLEQTPDERQETRFKVSLSGGIWGKSPKEITLPDNSTVGVDLSFMIGSDTYSFDISSLVALLFPSFSRKIADCLPEHTSLWPAMKRYRTCDGHRKCEVVTRIWSSSKESGTSI